MQLREVDEDPTRRSGGLPSVGREREDCPICRRGRPLHVVTVLRSAWITAPPRAALPGYVAVVAKRHVVEPFELPASAGFAFWRDVLVVAKALADLFSPIKMNYEIHGNTIPHLHVHVYPRFPADPFVGRPIDPRQASFVRSKAERTRMGRAIQRAAAASRSKRTAHR